MASTRRSRVARNGGLNCHYCGFLTYVSPADKAKVEATFPTKIAPGKHRKRALAARMFTIDHVQARSKGGADHDTNMVPACFLCNSMKANGSEEQFRFLIKYMLKLEIHPHQIFQKSGMWFQPEHTHIHQIRKAKK